MPILDPSEILSRRKNNQAAYTIPVRPERQQELAEALYVLFTTHANRKRSDIVIDAIVSVAIHTLKENPALMLLLEKRLIALLPEVNSNNRNG